MSPLLRTGSLLFRVDPTQLADQGGADPSRTPAQPSAIPQGWVWLALSKNGQEVAAVGGDRAELARWRGTSQISVPFFGSRLTPPTFDPQNFLWVGGQTDGRARLWTVNASADPGDAQSTRPMPVDAPWLSRRVVVAQRVASDGQRVAVISTAPGGQDPRVDVAGVVRAENGRPEKLADPVRIASTLTLARDLVWVDQTTVAVLGRITPSSPVRVWTAEVGGRLLAAEVSDVPGARAITSTNGERGLVVTTDGEKCCCAPVAAGSISPMGRTSPSLRRNLWKEVCLRRSSARELALFTASQGSQRWSRGGRPERRPLIWP